MFEQNKGGASSPQASNLAGMFQNAGSFMPQQVNLPQITAPTAATALQTAGQAGPMSFGSGTTKGTPNAVPGGGIEGMLAQAAPIPLPAASAAPSPQQAAAATAARMQALSPAPIAAQAAPTETPEEELRRKMKEHQAWQRAQR